MDDGEGAVDIRESDTILDNHGENTDGEQDDQDSRNKPFAVKELTRRVGLWELVPIAFMLCCGGPFGAEDAVAQGGPLLTLIGLILLPLFWALPQALMAAELASIFPANGGSVVWVREAYHEKRWGGFLAFVYNANALVSNVFDIAMFPVLLSDYLRPWTDSAPVLLTVRGAAIALSTLLNCVGIESVSRVELVLTVAMFIPFIVQLVVVIAENRATIDALLPLPERGDGTDWGVFTSTMLWLQTGWITLGTVAGEVKDAGKTFPRGVVITIVLATANFLIPICAGLWVQPDWKKWETGGFTAIAFEVGEWLGFMMLAASLISNFGQLNADVACCSRMTWAMGHTGTLPRVFGFTWKRFQTPVVAVLANSAVVAVLAAIFPFTTLVQFSMFFNNVNLLVEFSVFVWLKHRDPRPRPFAVPFGKPGAWAITIPKVIVVLFTWTTAMWPVIVSGVSGNILFAVLYFILRWWSGRNRAPVPEMHPLTG
jgi:amino acid transporter